MRKTIGSRTATTTGVYSKQQQLAHFSVSVTANCSNAERTYHKAKGPRPTHGSFLLSRRRWVQEQVNRTATMAGYILARKRQSAPAHILASCRANRIWARPPQPPARRGPGHMGGETLACPCCPALVPLRVDRRTSDREICRG